MTRPLSAANIAAAQGTNVRIVTFAELGFDSGTIYVHNSIGTFTWGGNNWIGVGSMGNISQVTEAETINPYKLQLQLSAVDATFVNEALNNDPFNRPISVYVGFLDDTEQLVADPDILWSGKMQQMNIQAGNVNTCTVIAESRLIRFKQKNGLLFNDKAHQDRFPGDVFFE